MHRYPSCYGIYYFFLGLEGILICSGIGGDVGGMVGYPLASIYAVAGTRVLFSLLLRGLVCHTG